MRRLVVWLVASSTGCNSILGIEELADPEVCLGVTPYNVCAEPIASPMRFNGTPIDTTSDPRCETRTQVSGPDFCLISARSITVVGDVPVIGARPLVLFASDSILITTGAKLDASSRRAVDRRGANANSEHCDPGGTLPGSANGAGGGAGGSFGGRGGDGGQGANGGAPGTAANPVTPTALRGGCSGRAGGLYMSTGTPADPGDSGGALYLIAGATITIQNNAYVLASGAAGLGGAAGGRGGGGGGGSGGMIVIDAPALTIDGHVVAHGGSGGEGGTPTPAGATGQDGADAYSEVSVGGRLAGPGGDGGDGSNYMAAAKSGQDGGTSSGGGGGGGGAGVILVRGPFASGAMITPMPTAL